MTGEGGLLTGLVQQVLQNGLEVELVDHLGYELHDPVGRGSGNSRNGSYSKTVVTEVGDVELRMPRDRSGSFEPVTVPKHTRRLDGLAGNVISLYAKGLTTGDIQSHLLEIYGTEISRETISKITDAVVDESPWKKWRLFRLEVEKSCRRPRRPRVVSRRRSGGIRRRSRSGRCGWSRSCGRRTRPIMG